MKSGTFDVSELRDTIKNLGFLPMDRIVVRKWRAAQEGVVRYITVEGNRRITALKWLIELHSNGRETFTPEQLRNFTNFEALVLDDEHAPDSAKTILPGLRHVSGIKEWGPYQKARAVHRLREGGATPQEAAQSLGLSTRAANQLWRSFLALELMHQDEEFGEHAEPKMYTYFEEVFRSAELRDWLGWDDTERRFSHQDRLREFFSWMIGEANPDGGTTVPRLPTSKDIRDLAKIINDESALAAFRAPGGTLARALARYESEHPEDWKPIVEQARGVLASLSPDTLRSLAVDDISALIELQNRIARVLEDRSRLLGHENG